MHVIDILRVRLHLISIGRLKTGGPTHPNAGLRLNKKEQQS